MQMLSATAKALLTIVLNCLLVLQDLAFVNQPLILCWDVAFSGYRCFELCNCLLGSNLKAQLVPASNLEEHSEATHGLRLIPRAGCMKNDLCPDVNA